MKRTTWALTIWTLFGKAWVAKAWWGKLKNVHSLSFHVLNAEYKSFFFFLCIATYNFSSKHKPVDFLPRLLFFVFSKLFTVFSIVVIQPSLVVKSCNDLLRPVTAWRKSYSYQFASVPGLLVIFWGELMWPPNTITYAVLHMLAPMLFPALLLE